MGNGKREDPPGFSHARARHPRAASITCAVFRPWVPCASLGESREGPSAQRIPARTPHGTGTSTLNCLFTLRRAHNSARSSRYVGQASEPVTVWRPRGTVQMMAFVLLSLVSVFE